MKLTKKDVKHVALLAKLSISESEEEKLADQLSEVVNYVSELNQVNTEGVEPTSQTTGLKSVFREEVVKPSLSAAEAISGTEETHNDYFLVPQIVSKES